MKLLADASACGMPRRGVVMQHPDVETPPQYATLVAELNKLVGTARTRADRAALLVVVADTLSDWVSGNLTVNR
ncbi:hypothetical protein [Luethyella okanaganae]|uniref:Uncharacterized protein n=1 Tax=Luethyella okanaganae TaxID=69372 RepID=A0ABW1VC66_9MICO